MRELIPLQSWEDSPKRVSLLGLKLDENPLGRLIGQIPLEASASEGP